MIEKYILLYGKPKKVEVIKEVDRVYYLKGYPHSVAKYSAFETRDELVSNELTRLRARLTSVNDILQSVGNAVDLLAEGDQ